MSFSVNRKCEVCSNEQLFTKLSITFCCLFVYLCINCVHHRNDLESILNQPQKSFNDYMFCSTKNNCCYALCTESYWLVKLFSSSTLILYFNIASYNLRIITSERTNPTFLFTNVNIALNSRLKLTSPSIGNLLWLTIRKPLVTNSDWVVYTAKIRVKKLKNVFQIQYIYFVYSPVQTYKYSRQLGIPNSVTLLTISAWYNIMINN